MMINVTELKRKIIDLAISGKLTKHLPEDGDAQSLLDSIINKKLALISSGILKKDKELKHIEDSEIPFEIPSSWQWTRLGLYAQKVTDQVASGSFADIRDNVVSLKEPDYAIMVKTADFANGFTKNLTYTNKHGYEFLENSNLFGGELILSNIGSIGKVFIVPKLEKRMTLAPNSIMVRLTDNNLIMYLYYFLLSSQGYKELDSISTGIAMKKFNKGGLKIILLPIPPLEEQKRIVAKLDEIFAELDKIDEKQTRLATIQEKMEAKILKLAIQGKLVEQRPEEGTGEELFKLIQEEKQELIKQGKIKKEKPLPTIGEDEIPFEIPSTWKWVRMNDVLDVRDGTHDSPKYYSEGVPFVTSKNLINGDIDFSNTKLISFDDARKINERSYVENDDILMAMIGTIGNPVIVKKDRDFCIKNVALIKNFCKGEMFTKYLYYFLKFSESNLIYIAKASVQQFISLSIIRNYIIPLPPFEEQKRIVAKIEELLPLCKG